VRAAPSKIPEVGKPPPDLLLVVVGVRRLLSRRFRRAVVARFRQFSRFGLEGRVERRFDHSAVEVLGDRHAQQVEDRRRDIEQAGGFEPRARAECGAASDEDAVHAMIAGRAVWMAWYRHWTRSGAAPGTSIVWSIVSRMPTR